MAQYAASWSYLQLCSTTVCMLLAYKAGAGVHDWEIYQHCGVLHWCAQKKSVTPGDFYGTSGKIPYMVGQVEEKKKKGEIPEKPRGIYTSPAKKGTFGYNKTTLSERMGPKGVATE
jgi:hypothetical protein